MDELDFATVLRIKSGQKEIEPVYIVVEHSYARKWNPNESTLKCHPRKSLFFQQFGSDSNFIEEFIDIENDDEEVLKYSIGKGQNFINECERHIRYARTHKHPATSFLDQNYEEIDWQEKINKIGWSKVQNDIFTRTVKVLDSDRLARLSLKNCDNEAIKLRTQIDKSAALFRQLLIKFNWDSKLTQWLHNILIQWMSDSYLAAYLDILRTLKSKCGGLIDRMVSNSLKGPSGEPLNLLLKRPWDPAVIPLALQKPAKVNVNAIVIQVPSSTGGRLKAPPSSRSRFFTSQMSQFTKFVPMHVPTDTGNCELVLEKMIGAVQEQISIHKRKKSQSVILLGWGFGAILSCYVSLVEKVDAIICLGFPMFFHDGKRGEADDPLLELHTPTLFVVGQQATDCSVDEIEAFRHRLDIESDLVVVNDTDAELKMDLVGRSSHVVTQSMIDRCIVDEISTFITRVLDPKSKQIPSSHASNEVFDADMHDDSHSSSNLDSRSNVSNQIPQSSFSLNHDSRSNVSSQMPQSSFRLNPDSRYNVSSPIPQSSFSLNPDSRSNVSSQISQSSFSLNPNSTWSLESASNHSLKEDSQRISSLKYHPKSTDLPKSTNNKPHANIITIKPSTESKSKTHQGDSKLNLKPDFKTQHTTSKSDFKVISPKPPESKKLIQASTSQGPLIGRTNLGALTPNSGHISFSIGGLASLSHQHHRTLLADVSQPRTSDKNCVVIVSPKKKLEGVAEKSFGSGITDGETLSNRDDLIKGTKESAAQSFNENMTSKYSQQISELSQKIEELSQITMANRNSLKTSDGESSVSSRPKTSSENIQKVNPKNSEKMMSSTKFDNPKNKDCFSDDPDYEPPLKKPKLSKPIKIRADKKVKTKAVGGKKDKFTPSLENNPNIQKNVGPQLKDYVVMSLKSAKLFEKTSLSKAESNFQQKSLLKSDSNFEKKIILKSDSNLEKSLTSKSGNFNKNPFSKSDLRKYRQPKCKLQLEKLNSRELQTNNSENKLISRELQTNNSENKLNSRELQTNNSEKKLSSRELQTNNSESITKIDLKDPTNTGNEAELKITRRRLSTLSDIPEENENKEVQNSQTKIRKHEKFKICVKNTSPKKICVLTDRMHRKFNPPKKRKNNRTKSARSTSECKTDSKSSKSRGLKRKRAP